MPDWKKITVRDWGFLRSDVTHHFVYTVFVILASSFVSYLIFSSLLYHVINLPQTIPTKTITVPLTANEPLYTERGSPYDNRTVNGKNALVIFHGSRDKKEVALTFDAEMTDGMKARYLSGITKSSYDKRIIETLIKTNTKATLFLTGMWIELYPQVTEDLSKNSLFEFGSHSYTDSSYGGECYGLEQIPRTLRIEDIGATEKLLREHAHIDNRLFRFPGGCYTPDDVRLVNEADDTVVHWDVAASDGFNYNTKQIIHNVVDNVQNGSIIVMHMNGEPTAPNTAEALPEIISQLKAKGYEFVKVNELLGMPIEPKSK